MLQKFVIFLVIYITQPYMLCFRDFCYRFRSVFCMCYIVVIAEQAKMEGL